MFEDLIARSMTRIALFEGTVSHMYLDDRGRVTVARGYMLPHVGDARSLPFMLRAAPAGIVPLPAPGSWTPRPATAAEIASNYDLVAAAKPDLVASAYRAYTNIDLDPPEIDRLTRVDLNETLIELQRANGIPNFAGQPLACQEALLDMGYNLGVGGLQHFHTMLSSIRWRDWSAAAAQCYRRGISDARNADTAALFRSLAAPGSQPATITNPPAALL